MVNTQISGALEGGLGVSDHLAKIQRDFWFSTPFYKQANDWLDGFCVGNPYALDFL